MQSYAIFFVLTRYKGNYIDTVFADFYPKSSGPRAKGGFCCRVNTYTRQGIGGTVAGHYDNSATILPYDRHQFLRDSHRSQEIDIYLILRVSLRLPLKLAEHHHSRVIHQRT